LAAASIVGVVTDAQGNSYVVGNTTSTDGCARRGAAGANASDVTTVQDAGPWYPHAVATSGNACVGGSNPYWNTTGVPLAAGNPCSTNGAGIDIADGAFSALELVGTSTILWRFGN
jgi:hypothetical protein